MLFNLDKLAEEIEVIYEQLMNLKNPEGNGKLLSANNVNFKRQPGWLQSAGIKVRDSVLEIYGKDQVKGTVCKVSAVYTSHISTLDLDHFFPYNSIKQRLDELDQSKDIVIDLKSKLTERAHIPTEVISQLIDVSERSTRGKVIPNPDITGLYTLYYNCCSNIWPMAGTFNSSKGDRGSFCEATSTMLNSIISLYGGEHFRAVFLKELQKTSFYSSIKQVDFNTKKLDLIVSDISEYTSLKLSEGLDNESTILPRFSVEETMLEKFLKSDLVMFVGNYRVQQEGLMNSALRNASYINPYTVSLSDLIVYRKMNRALIKGMAGIPEEGNADNSHISSQGIKEDEKSVAFKMLNIIFNSLKEDEVDAEQQFVIQVLNTLKNCIKDEELQGGIIAALSAIEISVQSPSKRKREDSHNGSQSSNETLKNASPS